MTEENPRWGHMRVLGELRKLGFRVSLQTVRRYRKDIPRSPSPGWRAFLENHRPEIWAPDFFTVHTLWFQTLNVFFFITHDRRSVVHVNVTTHPTAPWVWRQLINATSWGTGPRFLIRDRDRSYGGDFVARARRIGIRTVLTPIAGPQANAVAERLVGTFRRECLDHIIVINERHLRYVLREFVRHYNAARPHQTLELDVPEPGAGPRSELHGSIISRPVLGGLTHEYERKAARWMNGTAQVWRHWEECWEARAPTKLSSRLDRRTSFLSPRSGGGGGEGHLQADDPGPAVPVATPPAGPGMRLASPPIQPKSPAITVVSTALSPDRLEAMPLKWPSRAVRGGLAVRVLLETAPRPP